MHTDVGYIKIKDTKIGAEYSPYIVAEMSANHNGKIENAIKLIKTAKDCGANAVKIQTYKAETITINHNSPEFILKDGLWAGKKLFDLYKEAHTPWEWHKEIYDFGNKIGITIFSSPFDNSAVDFLEKIDNPVYKVASPELIDIPLIKYIAKTGKPIIFSTGMATFDEIHDAIEAARSEGAKNIIVLHCTASYPAPTKEANLSTLEAIKEKFNVVTGLSDHTQGTLISTLAVNHGASLIEKHFTLDRTMGGVDSAFSIEPNELKQLVSDVNLAKIAIGKPSFSPTESETNFVKNRRSLYVVKDIKKGEKLSDKNIKSIRPGKGMKPKYFFDVIGLEASRDLRFGEPLREEMINSFKIKD